MREGDDGGKEGYCGDLARKLLMEIAFGINLMNRYGATICLLKFK